MGPVFKQVAFYSGAGVAGFICMQLGVPLPWMIGPMLYAAALALMRRTVPVPRPVRAGGQVIVSTAVGLYFTPAALEMLISQAVYMVGAAFYILAAGGVAALVLRRLAGTDMKTAYFSCIPGGPVEMSNLAAREGGDGPAVALAQTFRIAAIVLIIPPLMLLATPDIEIERGLSLGVIEPVGLPALFALGLGAALFGRRLGIANAFFLVPLGASAVLTATGVYLSPVPPPLLAAGQLMLGVSLGVQFSRDLVMRAPRFLTAALVTTGLLLALCSLGGWAIARLSGMPFDALVLAMAPGSVTEMALTAKFLQQSVALVTAYHVVRLFILLPLTPVAYRLIWGDADAARSGQGRARGRGD